MGALTDAKRKGDRGVIVKMPKPEPDFMKVTHLDDGTWTVELVGLPFAIEFGDTFEEARDRFLKKLVRLSDFLWKEYTGRTARCERCLA